MSKRLILIVAIVGSLQLLSCNREIPGENFIMTVTGPLPAAEAGISLVHEHILVDWIGAELTGYHRWNNDSVISRVLPYLDEIRSLGVSTFIDCSPAFLGRDPVLLLDLAKETGLNIITNTGYYGAADNRFLPRHAWEETAEELARRWIGEYTHGIDSGPVKPGFIKIGVKEDQPLSTMHKKLIRAAALTHLETGLIIKSHTGGDIPAREQIEILRQEGVSPEAFIWTHAQNGSPETLLFAAGEGAWISFDGVNISSGEEGGPGNLQWYLDHISMFRDKGMLRKLLISHDAGWYDAGEPGGGGFRGYSDIHRFLIPALLENGFTPNEIDTLLSINPSEAFSIKIRR